MVDERNPWSREGPFWYCGECGFCSINGAMSHERFVTNDGCCGGCGERVQRLHLVTDADLRVLEIMSTLKIKMCVGEWMIGDARELELCKAELARRVEKP